ncbi:MAG: glycosyltransferase family 4 protein, partial [Paracoccaceae bacterium]
VPPTAAGVPLGLGRLRPESLTGRAETSIQSHIYGDRRSYTRAAQRWHAQGGGQHLPAHPQIRPFAAPPSLSIGAPTTPCATALVAGPDRMLDAGLFDDLWYMTTYPDLRAQDVDGVRHYWHHGAGEGRDPSAVFSTSGYARDHGISLADVPRHALAAGVVQYLPDWAGNRVGQHPKQPHIIVFGHKAGAEIFGAERVLLQVLDRAHLAGVRVSVVLPHSLSDSYHTAVLARCDRLFIRPYGWHFDGVAPPVATVQRLAALIEQTGADVVHQMTSVLSAPLCAAKAAGVPSVVHVHELPQQDPRLCYDMGTTPDALRGHLLRWADTCVAVSPAVAQWLDAPGRTQNWHNAVDTDLADLPTPAPHGRPLRVALIGSLTARKGIADYRALAQQSKRDGIDYVMIGPMTADLEALPRWPAVLHHAGYADTPTTALAQADIVVNLSLFEESHGLTIHEALVAGRPVVVYDQPALRNLIGDSGAGIIVPPRDITALRRAILRLRDPASFAAASQAARIRGATLQARAQNQGDALFRTPPRR